VATVALLLPLAAIPLKFFRDSEPVLPLLVLGAALLVADLHAAVLRRRAATDDARAANRSARLAASLRLRSLGARSGMAIGRSGPPVRDAHHVAANRRMVGARRR
jgi:hypothetical protein